MKRTKLKKILTPGLSALLLAALVAGCGSGADNKDASRADIRGLITSVSRAGGGKALGSILVEGVVEKDTTVDKAAVTVTPDTRIYVSRGGELEDATFDSLEVGQKAQATFTGPVAESYPVQAVASRIEILDPQ